MVSRLAQNTLLAMIHAYRHTLGLLLGGQCRFCPTCSSYALEAIGEWGTWKGLWMAAWRLARCHPLAKGGFDPVPANPQRVDGPGAPAANSGGDKP